MTRERVDYKRIIELLRKSDPSFDQQSRVEEYILRQIEKERIRKSKIHELALSLFRWANIPAARRTLAAVSLVLVGIFIFQQSVLINQVRNISRQVIVLKNENESAVVPDFGSRMMLYRISDQFRAGGRISISGKELERLIEAYNELDVKYKDLLKIVGENPELRSYVEKKLEENGKDKSNL
jgi:hypothetical protein